MRAARMSLCLAFLGLVLACEPDAAGPEMDALEVVEPVAALLSPAMGPMGFNMGAVVHKGEIGCRIVDGEGNHFPDDFTLPCTMEIANYGQNLVSNLVVKASGVPNPTGKLVRWDPYNPGHAWEESYPELEQGPYPCFVLGPDYDLDNPLYTVNWWAYVTPSGEAMLVCHYSKKWEFQWPG